MPSSSAKTKPAQLSARDTRAIVTRLNGILRTLLDYQHETRGTRVGDQILALVDAGLPQNEACRVLGINPSQASSYFRYAENKALLKKLRKQRALSK